MIAAMIGFSPIGRTFAQREIEVVYPWRHGDLQASTFRAREELFQLIVSHACPG
jgi:hypothetical protein